jgi:hypothetical protein
MICPHCGVGVREEWREKELAKAPGPGTDDIWVHTAFTFVCSECRRICIRYAPYRQNGIPLADEELVYPQPAPVAVPKHVPEPFAGDLREASLVLAVSPKASAALSRRILQALLVEKGGARKRDLVEQIEEVKPTLPPYIVRTVDAVRVLGNFAAHPTKDKSTGEIVEVELGEAELTMQTVAELMRFYFTEPAEADAVLAGINAKLAAAGKTALKVT